AVGDTNWHYVAVSKSGKRVVFCIDDVVEPALEYNYEFDFTFRYSAAIGSCGDGLGGTFYGMIDEVAVYDDALPVAQMTAGSHASRLGNFLSSAPPIAPGCGGWWRAEGNAVDAVTGVRGIEHGSIKYVPGIRGRAFSFDGNDSWIEIPDNPGLS